MDTKTNSKKGAFSKVMSKGGILIPYLVVFILISIASPHFLTASNIMVVLRQTVFVAIVGFGMSFVIGTGGIDLSVGSIVGLCGVIIGVMMKNGVNLFAGIIVTLLAGIAFGAGNGLLITRVKIPDFIATLGTMSILRGFVYVWTQGIPVYGLRVKGFQYLGQGYVGPIPFPIIVMLGLFFLCFYLLNKTKFGRKVISSGSNMEAARLVGINTENVKLMVYIICGFLCAVSAILLTSRVEAAVCEAGSGYEMDAIGATVIGGTSLSGGKANLIGTIFGALLMATIRNGLNLLNVSTYWHQVVLGAIILIAVTIDNISSRKIFSRNA